MPNAMRLRNHTLLKCIWRLLGQLRAAPNEPEKISSGVVIARFKNDARAAACISADFELCWAWRELPENECEERAKLERENVPFILQLLEEFQVPITWATVGHMFLERCERGSCGHAHPEMARPPRNNRWRGDWYSHDPCSNSKRAPGWYAPDLIEKIQKSKVSHEIATHSFSHIDFSEETSDAALVESEVGACISAMKPFGVKPRSLVFCFNHMGYQHSDLLYRVGIVAVRHRDARLRLASPERSTSGLYKLYESMNLRLAKRYNYFDKAKIFIDEAIRRRSLYHLWFHPSDGQDVFSKSLQPIVGYLSMKQQSNDIWITTMSDLACYREARQQMSVCVERRGAAQVLDLECPLNREIMGDPEVSLVVPCGRPPHSVSITGSDPAMSAPVAFRFDQKPKTVTFNVRSSTSQVWIE
jgi:hypothetical protein